VSGGETTRSTSKRSEGMLTIDSVVAVSDTHRKTLCASFLQFSHRDPYDDTHGQVLYLKAGGGERTTCRTLEA
jgi:hypothetical protein